jgi:hypothetical protein
MDRSFTHDLVIPTEAQRRDLHGSFVHPRLCHPDRSAAQRRDLHGNSQMPQDRLKTLDHIDSLPTRI